MSNTPTDRVLAYVKLLEETVAFQQKRKINVKKQQSKTAVRVATRNSLFPKKVVHQRVKSPKPKNILKNTFKNINPITKLSTTPQGDRKPNKEQLDKWGMLSYRQQIEYLKDHPKSIFRTAPLNRNKVGQNNSGPKVKPGANGSLTSHRDMSAGERKTALRNLELLDKPGALALGSKERENCATLLDQNGAASIKESLKPNEINDLLGEYKNVKHRAKINHKLSTTPKITPEHDPDEEVDHDPDEEVDNEEPDEDEEYEDERRHKKHRVLAYALGGLVIASLLGVALSAVSPSLALIIGYHAVNQLPGLISNYISQSGLILAEDEQDALIKEISNHAANYLRDQELPKDLYKKMKESIGKQHGRK